MNSIQMRNRFDKMWDTLAWNTESRDKVYDNYLKSYSDKKRHYHDIHHIVEGLEAISELAPNVRIAGLIQAAMEFAWWNHDYRYFCVNPEKESAKHALRIIKQSSVLESVPLSMLIEDCIEFSTHEHPTVDNKIVQYFLDIDLIRLGSDRYMFDHYSDQIRKEYAHVPVKEYNLARIEILSRFLRRPHIYLSEYFRGKYETQARKNIKRHIEELKNG